jgi:hypothetical protein
MDVTIETLSLIKEKSTVELKQRLLVSSNFWAVHARAPGHFKSGNQTFPPLTAKIRKLITQQIFIVSNNFPLRSVHNERTTNFMFA